MRRRAELALTALLLTGAVPPAHAQADAVCLDLSGIDHTQVLDDSTVLFVMRDRAVWKNTLPEPCLGLKAENGFEYSGGEAKLCGDIDLIHPLHSDASCALGPFTRSADQ